MASPLEGKRTTLANFGLATNLSLFFLGHFCILCCVPQESVFFLAGNKYLEVKKLDSPPSDPIVKEQVVTLAQPLERLLDVLAPGIFLLPEVLLWAGGYDSVVFC